MLQMVEKLRSLVRRVEPSTVPAYRVYTRDFDRIVHGKDLDSIFGRLSKSADAGLDESWARFENELKGWMTTQQLVALDASNRIKKSQRHGSLTDTAVTILVDQSGSMRGQNMLLAAAAVNVAQDLLRRLGVTVEILGFTTIGWRGGQSRKRWQKRLRPAHPGRLCDLLHIIYVSHDAPGRGAADHSLRPMLRADLLKENVDGEALEWASSRLRARSETQKILIVISDGAPVDDSTLSANDLGILDRHLREVIGGLEASSDVVVAALGVGFDAGQYYSNSRIIASPDDLGTSLISLLEGTLTGVAADGSVMAAYQTSLDQFGELYQKLAD